MGLYIGNIKFMLRLFLDEFHEGNDVMKGHNHGYILLFVCQKHNLWQQLGGPNDGAVCLKHNPSTPRVVDARIGCCKLFVTVVCDIGITIALEAFEKIHFEAKTDVTCSLEIFN